jgi:F-type H+-transporting ATPase subunit a
MYTLNSNNFNQEISSPLSQFEVRDLLFIDIPILENLHISLTNIGFFLTIGTLFIIILNISSTNFNKLVSNE